MRLLKIIIHIKVCSKIFLNFILHVNIVQKKYENAGISTGSWGCGAFWCDKAHKLLQQLVCSKCNNVKLPN